MILKDKIKRMERRLSLMSRGVRNGATAPCGKLDSLVRVHLCCKESFASHPACWHCADRIATHPQWEGLDVQWKKNQRSKKKLLAAMGSTAGTSRTSWHSDQAPIQEQEDDNGRGGKNRGPKPGGSGRQRANRAGSKGKRPSRRRPTRRPTPRG